MTDPDDELLSRLAASLSADDPRWARQFSGTESRRSHARWVVVVSGAVGTALIVAGLVIGSTPLVLMVVPVVGTAAFALHPQMLWRLWVTSGRDRGLEEG